MGAFGMQVSGVPVKIAIPAKCVTNRISTAGMVPSVLAVGTGAEFCAPTAIAVTGGLLLSTGLSLLFVHSLLRVVNNLKTRAHSILINAFSANQPAAKLAE